MKFHSLRIGELDYFDSFFAVSDTPAGNKGERGSFLQLGEIDLVGGIGWLVIVGVFAGGEEEHRHTATGEVVVVATVIHLLRMIDVIEGV